MAILWVSTLGSDAADGSTYALAKATFNSAFDASSQGDTIYMVNDGDHAGVGFRKDCGDVAGTDYDTDPGFHVKGVDSSGNAAMTTMVFTTSTKQWILVREDSDYLWFEGLIFDYSACAGSNQSSMFPIQAYPNLPHLRITDCELWYTSTVGSGVDITGDATLPILLERVSSAAAAAGELELYNNVLVNAQMRGAWGNPEVNFHHNILINDCVGSPTTQSLFVHEASTTTATKYYNNTFVIISYGTQNFNYSAIDAAFDSTSILSLYNNLSFFEKGAGVSTDSGFRFRGNVAASQVPAVQAGNNYVGVGTNLAADAADWDLSTSDGVYSYQFNPTYRGGGTNLGADMNTDDVLNRTITFATMFAGTDPYNWTPGDYTHVLPYDLRTQVGRTTGVGSTVVGAVEDSINQPPVGQDQSYSTGESVALQVTAASGLLTGATDPNADTLSITTVGTPSNGALTSYNTTTGSFVYTPNAFYSGSDSFTFQIWDGLETSVATYTASITVVPMTPPDPDVEAVYVDTAPFFKPTLRVATEFRIRTKKNRRKHIDIANYTEDRDWNESTHRVINLATNTTSQVTLGGVATAQYLIVETDTVIDVSINDTARYWPVDKSVAVALGEITSVYLRNNSTTEEAQVIMTVSD